MYQLVDEYMLDANCQAAEGWNSLRPLVVADMCLQPDIVAKGRRTANDCLESFFESIGMHDRLQDKVELTSQLSL